LSVVEGIPVVRVRFINYLSGVKYPPEGTVGAVVDTGYQGFAAVPLEIFRALKLGRDEVRRLVLADGRVISSQGGYATLAVGDYEVDGLVETYEGLSEVLIGSDALRRARLSVNYCLGAVTVERC